MFSLSGVSGVSVDCWNGIIYRISIGFHVFDTSSDYVVESIGPWGWRPEPTFNDSTYYITEFRELSLPFGEVILIFFENDDDPNDWIQLQLYISAGLSEGSSSTEHYAACYVEHSATYGGTERHGYYVNVWCHQLDLDVRSE